MHIYALSYSYFKFVIWPLTYLVSYFVDRITSNIILNQKKPTANRLGFWLRFRLCRVSVGQRCRYPFSRGTDFYCRGTLHWWKILLNTLCFTIWGFKVYILLLRRRRRRRRRRGCLCLWLLGGCLQGIVWGWWWCLHGLLLRGHRELWFCHSTNLVRAAAAAANAATASAATPASSLAVVLGFRMILTPCSTQLSLSLSLLPIVFLTQ